MRHVRHRRITSATRITGRLALLCTGVAFCLALLATPAMGAITGAIFTTDSACIGTNINIFTDKGDVYLDGGPAHPGAAGLPPGNYYVRITDPSGATLLGTSVGAADPTPFHVDALGEGNCIHLSDVLIKASDSTPGYDDTPNGGGVYKVWISPTSTFDDTKTDNFKAPPDNCTDDCVPPQEDTAELKVTKFYDANANGVKDGAEADIVGWQMRIQDNLDLFRDTPVDLILDPDTYTVTESYPLEANWFQTAPQTVGPPPGVLNPQTVVLPANGVAEVAFGNVCTGPGGGLTLGFWSNKNGQAAQFSSAKLAATLAFLSGLNLRNANGSNFDPGNYAAFRTWLLNANATNMAYMLSAQLAAMELNVRNGNVSASSVIYAPGTNSANGAGFATVQAVMDEANAELGLHGTTLAGSAFRSYQEALKNALDKANNNLTFAQASPCPFTFAP